MNLEAFFLINNVAGQNPFLDFLGIFGANYLIWILGFLVLVVSLYFRNPKIIITALFSLLLALTLDLIIGRFIREPRPFVVNGVHLLITHAANNSFPSTHTVTAFALAASLWFSIKEKSSRLRQFLYVFFLLAFLVGFSRVYAGVHYPLDILAGAIVGIASALFVARFLHSLHLSLR